MKWLTRSPLLATVNTSGAQWVVPTRLTFGMLLLFPIDGGMPHILAASLAHVPFLGSGGTVGAVLRVIEIIAGASFIAGVGITLAACRAVLVFGLRAVSNAAASSEWLRHVTTGLVTPHGNWGYGALYLGTALLADDLINAGSGRWSMDYWLSGKLGASRLHSVR